MISEKLVKNLRLRGYEISCFRDKEEAAAYIQSQIHDTTVGIGGSKTIENLGLYERLLLDNRVFWHWKNHNPEVLRDAANAMVYITSANAVSEEGEIVNIDGTGNRLSAQCYGTKKVYFVIGKNKICTDLTSAMNRARQVAAVKNAQRFPNKQIPCLLDGTCHDCRCADRICRAMLILFGPMEHMQCEVVLIDDVLGY